MVTKAIKEVMDTVKPENRWMPLHYSAPSDLCAVA